MALDTAPAARGPARRWLLPCLLAAAATLAWSGCSDDGDPGESSGTAGAAGRANGGTSSSGTSGQPGKAGAAGGTGGASAGQAGAAGATAGAAGSASGTAGSASGAAGNGGAAGTSGAAGTGGASDPGPSVDLSDPQLYTLSFTAAEADAQAKQALGKELAHLDTRVKPRGELVVYLHGAGDPPATCGSGEHGKMLAGLGFHVLGPCYLANYGIQNCGDDIEGCRLEAFDGTDHHPFVTIAPADSIEQRIVKGLAHAQSKNPAGDWTYFLDGGKPRWSRIVISGISHGASTAAVIGKHRSVRRVVSLSGPLDSGQAWLTAPSLTPLDRFFALSHTADDQHPGHLKSFEALGLPGKPTSIDSMDPPYGESHRLITSAPTGNGHVSTQAGSSSPKEGGAYLFLPAWTYLYAH